MDPYERSKLSDALVEEDFVKGDTIIREGDSGHKFYIIVEGTAVATKVFGSGAEPMVVMDYKEG